MRKYSKRYPNNWLHGQNIGKILRLAGYGYFAGSGIIMKNNLRSVLSAVALGSVLMAPNGFAQSANPSDVADLTGPQFNVMGFGDISYISRDAGDPGGFAVGQAVAHLTASLDDSFRVFAEFSMTATDNGYNAGVERMIVRYDFSDLFKLSAGRYHSPIGYWNSAFHHGAWLQTTVSRPEMVKFGSKIVPIHFVGALLEGTLPRNRLGLSYMAGFGNGRHENIAQAGDTGDINGDNAWMVQLNAAPYRYYGLRTGIGIYSDVVSPDDRPDINEQTISAYLAWAKESPEIIMEYIYSSHDLVVDSSASGNVNAWYAQFAYRLKGRLNKWKPYARFEKSEVDDSDPLLGDQGLNYDAAIFGARWDFNPYAALKAEYRNEDFDSSGRENNFRLQVSFVLAKL